MCRTLWVEFRKYTDGYPIALFPEEKAYSTPDLGLCQAYTQDNGFTFADYEAILELTEKANMAEYWRLKREIQKQLKPEYRLKVRAANDQRRV